MSRESKTKVPDVSRVVNAATGEGQELNAARESGWYRVKNCGIWVLDYYSSHVKKWGSDKYDLVDDKYWEEIDETPVNPVPADEVYHLSERQYKILVDAIKRLSDAPNDALKLAFQLHKTRVAKEGEA